MSKAAPVRTTGFLASVANLEEMDAALAFGVDIVDLKNPADGALGAWPAERIEIAVARWRARTGTADGPGLSATVGDHPLDAGRLLAAATRTAAAGVPLVKIGFALPASPRDAASRLADCLAALAPLAHKTRLIAVLFADQNPDMDHVPAFAAAGFAGVMLDTADKTSGGLRCHLDDTTLARFVVLSRHHGLMTGLAGSLGLADVAPLTALAPDYLGFRGALCATGRTGSLEMDRMSAIANMLRKGSGGVAG